MTIPLDRRRFLAQSTVVVSGAEAVLAMAQGAETGSCPPRKTILVVGAHMDDCEIGAGGLIVRAVQKGHRVVLVNVASDYSTWCVTKGREKQLREQILAKAKEMGVEKRFLEFGYQQVTENLAVLRRIAEVVVDVKPDITLIHDRQERERAPSDHCTIGLLAEQAVRCADTILGGLEVSYKRELYAFEIYPQRDFRPDVFIDISQVLKPVSETINFFGKLYAGSPRARNAGAVESTVTLQPGGEVLNLGHYAEMKLATARFRGAQCGLRFAEAYKALDPAALGVRSLEQLLR